MKKPLILLVDDDRTVLDALEAELTPVVASICRIEAFDDPLDVLQAVPGWAAEERVIALAIVDQRMPEMSGVNLVRSLRADAREHAAHRGPDGPRSGTIDPALSHPATYMAAMLLTGYASLDSAVDALNRAEIQHYMEKPWQRPTLIRAARRLVLWACVEAGTLKYVDFRRIVEPDELEAYLQLRAAAQGHWLAPAAPTASTQLDVDEYDTESAFFGVFAVNAEECSMLGGARMVGLGTADDGRALFSIVNGRPELVRRATAKAREPLALLNELTERDAIRAVVNEARDRGARVGELSKLTALPTTANTTPVGVTQALIETAIAVGRRSDMSRGFTLCPERHRPLYERAGFRLAPGTASVRNAVDQTRRLCLTWQPEQVPAAAAPRLDAFASRLEANGSACRCPALAECLGGAYQSGDFAGTDVFCPELAVRKLGQLAGA